MAIYFTRDFGRPVIVEHRCLFCEQVFQMRQELNAHYLTAHESAFSDAELKMARAQRAGVEQKLD
jgi:hypothetical protein